VKLMTPRSVLHKHSKPRRSMLIVFSRLINMDVMCVARALLCFHTHVSSAFHMKALPPLGGHILSHRLTHKAASCLGGRYWSRRCHAAVSAQDDSFSPSMAVSSRSAYDASSAASQP
jgi:hypothetical protein